MFTLVLNELNYWFYEFGYITRLNLKLNADLRRKVRDYKKARRLINAIDAIIKRNKNKKVLYSKLKNVVSVSVL